jgi:arylsulfatase A-like enzyme
MTKEKLPNIIIFNPDQWRSDVMGHLGNPAAVTPNLDKIVSQDAVSFSSAFCQNPVCTPSRCSFMTGWYPHVRGHRTMNHMLHDEWDESNLLKKFKDNGYFIWWGGKNDMIPGGKGQDFSKYCDVKFTATDADRERWGLPEWLKAGSFSEKSWRGDPDNDKFFSFYHGKISEENPTYFKDEWDMILGAVDFINNYDGDKPFCIYLPICYPHPPYGVEEPWYSITDRNKIPPRVTDLENCNDKPSILQGIRKNQRLHNLSEDFWQELRGVYYGMCSRVDHQFGLVVEKLKEKQLYDESAIFMFSDHGDFTGDYGIVEKTQNTFEDCLSRIPFIIKPPVNTPVKPGVKDALVELVDFSATVYDMTGIDPGYDHFGKSLLPLIAGKTDQHRDAVFCEGGRRYGELQASEIEYIRGSQPTGLYRPRVDLQATDDGPYHTKAAMCRTEDFKYVMRLYEKDELYDLKKDPGETRNQIDNPEYVDILFKLKNRMLDWYMETCDVVPQKTDSR